MSSEYHRLHLGMVERVTMKIPLQNVSLWLDIVAPCSVCARVAWETEDQSTKYKFSEHSHFQIGPGAPDGAGPPSLNLTGRCCKFEFKMSKECSKSKRRHLSKILTKESSKHFLLTSS